MKRLVLALLTILAILVVVILFNTFTVKSKQVDSPKLPGINVSDTCIRNLQAAMAIPTISYDNRPLDTAAFGSFQRLLISTFPNVFNKLKVEIINDYALLIHWKGENPSQPVILMAHQDVVPVEESSIDQWNAPPFSGAIINDSVYGRGAVDDKGSLMAILEAAEILLKQNYIPKHDIYFAFGHDEEIKGINGAKKIAEILRSRNIKPAFVLDEGGIITSKEIPGVTEPVALVGITEKGYMTVDLEISITGGHSSMPKRETAIDQLASAIVKLKENPFPASFNDAVSSFMDFMGPHMPFVQKMAFANRWAFSPLIKNIYSKKPGGDAMIRTTTAPTLFNAGVKENVIPSIATATVNFRTQPGTTEKEVMDHIKAVIQDERISISVRPGSTYPRAIADVNGKQFKYFQKAIKGWRQEVITSPYIMLGASDGRYFTTLTPEVFRFIPFNDIKGYHGINERIGIDEYKKGIEFYYYLIREYQGL